MFDYSGETRITVILKCINGSNKNLYWDNKNGFIEIYRDFTAFNLFQRRLVY